MLTKLDKESRSGVKESEETTPTPRLSPGQINFVRWSKSWNRGVRGLRAVRNWETAEEVPLRDLPILRRDI
jgi:hypothetical protein